MNKNTHKTKFDIRTYLILAIIATEIIFIFFFLSPIAQNKLYHNFADTRTLIGIPNFFNVLTNLPFVFVGLAGIKLFMHKRADKIQISWVFFFIGATLVGFGSAYYHYEPNNSTLVWDRLPMTVGFTALFCAMICEFINVELEKYLLPTVILTGIASVIYWNIFDDLRFYMLVQLTPLILIPFIISLFKSSYSHKIFLLYGFLFYAGAKVVEKLDEQIFSALGQSISGHSIKHLLASIAILMIFLMLNKRKPIS